MPKGCYEQEDKQKHTPPSRQFFKRLRHDRRGLRFSARSFQWSRTGRRFPPLPQCVDPEVVARFWSSGGPAEQYSLSYVFSVFPLLSIAGSNKSECPCQSPPLLQN